MNRSPLTFVVRLLLVSIVAVPAAFILALVTSPLWSWLEQATGIEAMGHSGPATWCFLATYIVVIAVALSMLAPGKHSE